MPKIDNEAVSISGQLLMRDDATPHVACVVQAVKPAAGGAEPTVVLTTLSDESGRYRLTELSPGAYQVRCYTLSGCVYYQDGAVIEVDAQTLEDIDFRFAPFKKGMWKNYTSRDGFRGAGAHAVCQAPDRAMWFATGSLRTPGCGVARYDGRDFMTLTTTDGLMTDDISVIHHAPDGRIWLASSHWSASGVCYYEGKDFTTFTAEDGLPDNVVRAIESTPDGAVWLGTDSGLTRYNPDEATFTNFTTADGLVNDRVFAIRCDNEADLWVGTAAGVSKYDGDRFENFTTEDGLADGLVGAIGQAADGAIWFGTGHTWEPGGGLSRYDGAQFTTFTTENGLLHNTVMDIDSDLSGAIWLATFGGISRYDGTGFINFTDESGAPDSSVEAVCCDADGSLWFGTGRSGVFRYAPETAAVFTTADGLGGNFVQAVEPNSDGTLWVGTDGGASYYDGHKFLNFTTDDGLAHNVISTIHRQPDGTLWFGTGGVSNEYGGLSRYDETAEGKKFVTFTVADGLANDRIFSLESDRDGTLWIGTSRGLSCYDGNTFRSDLAIDTTGFTDGLSRLSTAMERVCCGVVSSVDVAPQALSIDMTARRSSASSSAITGLTASTTP